MLYSNTNIKVKEVEMEWGILKTFNLGEAGRGRREIRLPSNIPEDTIKRGVTEDLVVGFTKNGKPRINKGKEEGFYLILSSYGGYTRRGNGKIFVPIDRQQEVKVLALGNGADGDAGRIGFWDCAVLQVPNDFFIKVHNSGGTPETYYLIRDKKVFEGSVEGIIDLFDTFDEVSPYPIVKQEGGDITFDKDYWENIRNI